MPSKYYRRIFIKGYYYHIYNRGANKEVVFKDDEDYRVFIEIMSYYLTFPLGKPLSIVKTLKDPKVPNLNNEAIKSTCALCTYCLVPNHFHLIIKQQMPPTTENSITNLMRRLTITYAMYMREKYSHSGTLFQGKFKNVLVNSDLQLLQLSKYIHRNPIEYLGSEPLNNYEYSSYKYFIGSKASPDWLSISDILNFFSATNPNKSYQNFVEEVSTEVADDILKKVILE